jgi:uncharacterized protein
LNSEGRNPSAWHTFLLIGFLLFSSYLFASLDVGSRPPAQGRPLLYCQFIAFEWMLFAFVFFGSDKALRNKIKSIFRNPSKILIDTLIAAAIWAFFAVAAPHIIRVLGYSGWGSTQALLPVGMLQVVMWIVLSMSAGFCEEVVFRGYLQEQFARWTRLPVVGLLAQAILFGISHGYQGPKNMTLIAVLGCIFGVVVLWRKQLRPSVIAHTCIDIAGAF